MVSPFKRNHYTTRHSDAKTMQWFVFFLQILLLPSFKIAAKVPAVIVFGDSTVDAGNNNEILTILKSNFLPYGRDFPGGLPTGRFSNGRLATDFISEAFGCKATIPAYLDPRYTIKDFATGVCFASAGTGYDNATSSVLSVIPLWKELEYYRDYQTRLKKHLGVSKANVILHEALYLISLGTNDFIENYFPTATRSVQYTVEQYENFLLSIAANFIRDIYGLGARKIAIAGLPPMGCLPLVRTLNPTSWGHCVRELNDLAKGFNEKLATLIAKMNRDLKEIRVVHVDSYDVVSDIIAKPLKYGKIFFFGLFISIV